MMLTLRDSLLPCLGTASLQRALSLLPVTIFRPLRYPSCGGSSMRKSGSSGWLPKIIRRSWSKSIENWNQNWSGHVINACEPRVESFLAFAKSPMRFYAWLGSVIHFDCSAIRSLDHGQKNCGSMVRTAVNTAGISPSGMTPLVRGDSDCNAYYFRIRRRDPIFVSCAEARGAFALDPYS
jgi:hypothetical protein